MRISPICVIILSIASCKKHDDVITPVPQTQTNDTTKVVDTTQKINITSVIYYGKLQSSVGLPDSNATVTVVYRSRANKDSTIAFINELFAGSFNISPENKYILYIGKESYEYLLKGDSLYANKYITYGQDFDFWGFNGKRK